jgi:hypothetical protein
MDQMDEDPMQTSPQSDAPPAPIEDAGNKIFGINLPSAVHAVAWSTGAAAIAWLASCLGQTYWAGKYDALGLDALSLPAVDQRHVLAGMATIFQSAIDVVIAIGLARLIYVLLKCTPAVIASKFRWKISPPIVSRLWFLLLFVVFVDIGFFLYEITRLEVLGQGMILKKTSEVGSIWTQVVFDQDRTTVAELDLYYGIGLSVFVTFSYWLITKQFKQLWSKVAFSVYALSGSISMLFGYSYLHGMADTVRDFPVVAHSGMSATDPKQICFLLGEDDKMIAVLNLQLNGTTSEVDSRYVVFLPRTEVKWISIIRYMPLYRVADIVDLERIMKEQNPSKAN